MDYLISLNKTYRSIRFYTKSFFVDILSAKKNSFFRNLTIKNIFSYVQFVN